MILHVDMDAFYASVEERDDPRLRGRPVIVGGSSEGRGVVSAANYRAREFGVHSAMPAVTAKRLCPNAAFLPVRMDVYATVARQIREIFFRYTPLVEPLSLDEAFLDVAGSESLFGTAPEIGRQIQASIRNELSLDASVGVAPNKFLAKLSSDLKKPRGFVVVDSERIEQFLDPLPVSRIWGVGKAAQKVLTRLGVETIAQLRAIPVELLRDHFGRGGDHMWRLARGIDDRSVVPDRAAKSISHETTFAVDLESRDALRIWLMGLTEQVARRLRRHQFRARTVNLKIRYGDFHTITRAITLPEPTDITDEIWSAAAELFDNRLPTRKLSIRLLGVGVSGIETGGATQQLLFEDEQRARSSRLDHVSDEIKQRFGGSALKRAAGMRPDPEDSGQ